MEIDNYLTIEKPSEGLYRDKGSRFIAFAFPVENEEEVNQCRAGLRKKYPEAFSRPYDQGSGLKFERILAKGVNSHV